jgi:DNA polymerase elongation subunit (family B)
MTNNIFVYSWTTDDGEYSTSIRCYGIDEDGCSVVLKINDFNPYIYIEIPRNEEDVEELQRQLFNLTTATKIVEKDHLYSRFDSQKKSKI